MDARLDRFRAGAARKYDDALAELDRADCGRPGKSASAQVAFGDLSRKEAYDDAVRSLKKRRSCAAGSGNSALLGHVYLEKKDYPDAVKELIVAYKMNPNANDVLGDLVAAQYLNNNYPAALDGLDLLSRREPLPPALCSSAPAVTISWGRPAEALDAYKKFLDVNTDQNNDMYFEAAAACERSPASCRTRGNVCRENFASCSLAAMVAFLPVARLRAQDRVAEFRSLFRTKQIPSTAQSLCRSWETRNFEEIERISRRISCQMRWPFFSNIATRPVVRKRWTPRMSMRNNIPPVSSNWSFASRIVAPFGRSSW